MVDIPKLEEEASQYASENASSYDSEDYKNGWCEAYEHYIEMEGDV